MKKLIVVFVAAIFLFSFSSCQKDELNLKDSHAAVIELSSPEITPTLEVDAVLVSTSDQSRASCDSIYFFDGLKLELTPEEVASLGSSSYVSILTFETNSGEMVYIKDTAVDITIESEQHKIVKF